MAPIVIKPHEHYPFTDKFVFDLINRLHIGWTFNDVLRAMFIALHSRKRDSTFIQAIMVGLCSTQQRISIAEAYARIQSTLLGESATAEYRALTQAKSLLKIK